IGVVADLHLGLEYELSEKGVKVVFQHRKLSRSILRLVEENSVDQLILLGDVKHTVLGFRHAEMRMVYETLQALGKRVKVTIVPGNHDGGIEEALPEGVELVSPRGKMVRDSLGNSISLVHGHAWPSSKLLQSEVLIIAHSHPTIELRDITGYRVIEPVWIKADCNRERLAESYLRYKGYKVSEEPVKTFKEIYGFEPKIKYIIIVPAYNPLLGGIRINRKDMGPEELIGVFLLNKVLNLPTAEIYLVDGTFLGELKYLLEIS
ncbi:MAG TPA: hypothetical protein ENF55_00985, partial [Thermoprotei archaeon]|nr:hypothetical protein [Thermoprotei archaeon]